MTEQTDHPEPSSSVGPWRLLVLLGWVMFVLVHDHRIPGIELAFLPQLVIVTALMVASWFSMPHRRAELLGVAVLIAVGMVGIAANLTLEQKMAILGAIILVPIGYALWLVRHASLRLRLVLIAMFAGVIMVEVFAVGLEHLFEALTDATTTVGSAGP